MRKRVVLAFVLHSAFCILHSAYANELSVDKRTLHPDDTLTIQISLEGSFARTDAPRLPLQNLVLDGPPSMSSEFRWINGETTWRKIFRYTAHPRSPGVAVVGPVIVRGANGVALTLPAIPILVAAEVISESNDPVRIMRELIATNRDPIFILAHADKVDAFQGEEVVVTWTLYSGETIQQYSLGEIPKLPDFWTEELDVRSEQPQQVMLGGIPAQKVTIRRAALFPLRSGTLTVGSMALHASVMKRTTGGDPFGLFEGVMADVHRRSPPLTLSVRPIPPGAPVVGVAGVLNLTCGGPSQKSGGPVVFDLLLSGRANLRSAQPPAWQSPVDGNVQIVDRGVKVFPVNYDAWMTRRWRYLVFPSRSGELRLPALAATYLTTSGERRQVRCDAKTLNVSMTPLEEAPTRSASRHLRSRSFVAPLGSAVALALALLIVLPRARKKARLRADVQHLLRATPSETRVAVEEALASRGLETLTLMREASDRGDAFRAFRSLIDAVEHDRIAATQRDIAHRIRDLLVATNADRRLQAAGTPASAG